MKIREVAEMGADEDGLPILSISEGEVVGIGKVNTERGRQLIAVSDESGNSIKVALMDKNLFLIPGTEGLTVSFKSGPPIKNKPTGLIYRHTDKGGMVEVSGKAILIMHGENQMEKGPIKYPTDKEAGEIHAKELAQLTETVNVPPPALDTQEYIGFNDDYFWFKLQERRHLFEMAARFSAQYSLCWSSETIWAVASGLVMDGIHNQKTVIKLQQVKKEKFQPIEKPHNPEPVKEHPVAEMVQSSIIPFLEKHAKSGWGQVQLPDGAPLIDALHDAKRRGAMMHFYFSCKALNTPMKGKNKERLDALSLFIDELPRALEAAMAVEAMTFDIAKARNIDYTTCADQVENMANEEAEKYIDKKSPNDIRGVVMRYFQSVAKSAAK